MDVTATGFKKSAQAKKLQSSFIPYQQPVLKKSALPKTAKPIPRSFGGTHVIKSGGVAENAGPARQVVRRQSNNMFSQA